MECITRYLNQFLSIIPLFLSSFLIFEYTFPQFPLLRPLANVLLLLAPVALPKFLAFCNSKPHYKTNVTASLFQNGCGWCDDYKLCGMGHNYFCRHLFLIIMNELRVNWIINTSASPSGLNCQASSGNNCTNLWALSSYFC